MQWVGNTGNTLELWGFISSLRPRPPHQAKGAVNGLREYRALRPGAACLYNAPHHRDSQLHSRSLSHLLITK